MDQGDNTSDLRPGLTKAGASHHQRALAEMTSMSHLKHDLGIAKNIGRYSDAVETASGLRWLYSAGMPGMTANGDVPAGIEAQTRLVWSNLLEALERAQMTTDDLVKVTTTLINPADIAAYGRIRAEILGDARPVFMLTVVNQLVRPDLLVEAEIVAAASNHRETEMGPHLGSPPGSED